MIDVNKIDKKRFEEIAISAQQKLKNSRKPTSWIKAIEKAIAEIYANPFIAYDTETHTLLMLSLASNRIYVANGTCECKAYEKHKPCYHRAIARLFERYLESEGINC